MSRLTYLVKKIFVKLIPVKKNRIVFMSYNGLYTDAPKYIYEKWMQKNTNLEMIWLVKKEEMNLIPDSITHFDINSWKGLFFYGSANIIIDNVFGNKETYLKKGKSRFVFKILTWLNQKKKQHVYSIWHGTIMKKMGKDQIGSNIIDFSCPDTTIILSDESSKKFLSNIVYNKIEMKIFGSPRKEILIKYDIDKIKEKLNIDKNERIVLFAPTFRSDSEVYHKNIERSGINQLNEFDFERLLQTLSNKFGGEWTFICRFHYHVSEMVDWNELTKKYNGKVKNGNIIDDMNEYLAIADILISDISSCLFDFSCLERPSFIFFPDYTYYKDIERGFYYNIKELPFPFSIHFNELIDNINHFEVTCFKERIQNMNQQLGFYNSNNAINEIIEYIIKERNLNE